MVWEVVDPDEPSDFGKDIANNLKFLLKIGMILYVALKRAGHKVGRRLKHDFC